MTGSMTSRPGSTGGTDAVVTTVAGVGTGGSDEDRDGRAVRTQLRRPTGIAVDAARKIVYIADAGNHRVRRIQHGVITTVAGTGEAGSGGDGGAAVAARLASPTGVAVDDNGILYIADRDNHRVRRVDHTGHITTVAGTGEPGPGGDGGAAVAARLASPTGVAVDDNGILYIADRDNHRVRRVDHTGHITTVAGGGAAVRDRLVEPTAIAVDRAGVVYVAEYGADRVSRIEPGGTVTTIAGRGVDDDRAGSRLCGPCGVAVGGDGDVYIADTGGHRVRKLAAGVLRTVAGTGLPGRGELGGRAVTTPFDSPRGVAVDEFGNVFVADTGSHRIRKITLVDRVATVGGDGQRPAPGSIFPRPLTVRITREGRPVIAVPVTFTITGDTTSGARFSESTPTRWVARTNLAGEAAAELTAGPTPGTVRIEAAVGIRVAAFTAAVESPRAAASPAR
ncbi:hypothetical protein FHR81_003463 [Actinoalloteichus hoggarensis]|uniref:Serine/threonine-protein kinase PknD n=1 Tax=Actinoalloteichus hoggarensis TaxID=1470176 RepID=A0A221W7Y1_9PSEU|nr:hypothetical protein [Actinoalloteichus hoggarensis]ASO21813.1 Serine/threonine-protein kinase PknD [Actinoalloteichus hoggarensis]MBB5922411.1 hypothetical protein [Actinoalloteichus hoggarensis]